MRFFSDKLVVVLTKNEHIPIYQTKLLDNTFNFHIFCLSNTEIIHYDENFFKVFLKIIKIAVFRVQTFYPNKKYRNYFKVDKLMIK